MEEKFPIYRLKSTKSNLAGGLAAKFRKVLTVPGGSYSCPIGKVAGDNCASCCQTVHISNILMSENMAGHAEVVLYQGIYSQFNWT